LDPDGNDIADDTTAAVEDISDEVECNDNDNDTIGESGSTDHVHKKRRTSRNTSSNSTASESISRGKANRGKGKAKQIKEPEPEPELFKVLTEDEIRNKVSNNFLHTGVPLYAYIQLIACWLNDIL
jgi:hypothetical protein